MPKKKPTTTGQRITAARITAGLNRHQLAKASGLDHKHVRQLEDGFCEPKRVTLKRLAHGLGCDWLELVGD